MPQDRTTENATAKKNQAFAIGTITEVIGRCKPLHAAARADGNSSLIAHRTPHSEISGISHFTRLHHTPSRAQSHKQI